MFLLRVVGGCAGCGRSSGLHSPCSIVGGGCESCAGCVSCAVIYSLILEGL